MAKQDKKQTKSKDSIAEIAALGGKLPPQVLDFEEAVLGELMLDKDALQDVIEILKPEHFYKEANRLIYSAILRLNIKMAAIDMLTVANELKANNELDLVGGRFYLVQLTERVATAVNIEDHARIILQKYLQRSIIQLGHEMISDGFDDTKDIEDSLEDAESKLFDLSQGSMKRDVVHISPIINQAIEQMKEASMRKDNLSGLPSGFAGIDRITSGWQKATMIVIAARPAMGKTAFVLSMARKMALDYKIPIAIFSLEMSCVELAKRLLSAETEIPSEKIKNGRLTNEEWSHFNTSSARLVEAPIYIDDTPGLSVFDLRSKARILKKKHDVKMIIIDYLQLMTASAMRPGNRQEEVSIISRSLKGLAKELEIPIVALSQLNRSVESRGATNDSGIDGKRPQLSDLRESGAIEQDADMVCFIHRPEYYHILEDKEGNSTIGKAMFIIAKHRSGAVDDIWLRFQAELIRFEDIDTLQNSTRPQNNNFEDDSTIISSGINSTSNDDPIGDFSNEFTSNNNDFPPKINDDDGMPF